MLCRGQRSSDGPVPPKGAPCSLIPCSCSPPPHPPPVPSCSYRASLNLFSFPKTPFPSAPIHPTLVFPDETTFLETSARKPVAFLCSSLPWSLEWKCGHLLVSMAASQLQHCLLLLKPASGYFPPSGLLGCYLHLVQEGPCWHVSLFAFVPKPVCPPDEPSASDSLP